MEEQIVFGDEMMPVTLPDNIQSALPGLSTTLSAVENIEATVRQALLEPLGRPLLSEMAKSNWKVTIAFDDPTVLCFAPVWEPAIRLVIKELEKAGVKRSNLLKNRSGLTLIKTMITVNIQSTIFNCWKLERRSL